MTRISELLASGPTYSFELFPPKNDVEHAVLAKTLRDNLMKDYPTEVRAYFFDFPLETLHPWAKQASIDGRCIFRQSVSAFWDYHDWIFENQGEVTADNLKAKVIEFGKTKDKDVDMGQLNSCMDTRATEADVNKTQALGHLLEVNQTPTMFVNGRRLAGRKPRRPEPAAGPASLAWPPPKGRRRRSRR